MMQPFPRRGKRESRRRRRLAYMSGDLKCLPLHVRTNAVTTSATTKLLGRLTRARFGSRGVSTLTPKRLNFVVTGCPTRHSLGRARRRHQARLRAIDRAASIASIRARLALAPAMASSRQYSIARRAASSAASSSSPE
jgi:hypothetical protein